MSKKLLSVTLCAVFIASFLLNGVVFAKTDYPKSGEINSSSGSAKIYSLAGTTGHEALPENKNKSKLLCELKTGTKIQIFGEEADGDGDVWYKIGYGENFANVGYAFSSRVRVIYEYTYDTDFEKNLINFPESYHNSLRSLHAKYPNWQFVAHNLDLSFKDAVEAQYGVSDVSNTRKWVEFTYGGTEWRDIRAYDAASDTWLVKESRWTYASRAAIEYFMDPRNSLDENKIFVFMLQSYNKDMFSVDALRSVIKNTFLENGYDQNSDGIIEKDAYVNDIIAAAQQSNVSPYVIAATIIIEQGTKGSTDMISGKYKGFEGYYNFFNFSASGNTPDQITKAGLTYAKQNGWNSRTAAITGGAKLYADGYISVGQDTYYYKDFNVVNQIWWHQYAAALYDAWTNASYLKKGCLVNTDAALTFTIPVFRDMPALACPIPTNTPPAPPAQPDPPTEPSNIIGDINSDYIINNKDYGILAQYINNWPVEINLNNADTNADGKINNKDLGLLIQYINKWDVTLGKQNTSSTNP